MQSGSHLWNRFDHWVLVILKAILGFGIIAAIAIVIWLIIRRVPQAATEIDNIEELQKTVQAMFAGILLVVLGLELMDTLRNYFIEHHMRVELLISVALIAVARHVIQLDYEHISPGLVAAMAFLVLALSGSYVAVCALMKNDTEKQQ